MDRYFRTLSVIFALIYILSSQITWIKAVNTNESQTCWSLGEANIKPFSVGNPGFVSFNGNEGYYTFVDNTKLTIEVGIRILNDVPINCAVYLTNKEASTTVYIDFCPFSLRPANKLTGYSINNGSDVATDCSYLIALYNVTKDLEWLNEVPAQSNSLSAGFKCARLVPSPFLDSIAIRAVFSSSDNDMIILVDSMNSYYMPKVYIYNANVPISSSVGLCTLDDVPRTPATLSPYIYPFPGTNGTLLSPSSSSEATTTRMNAISMCRSVFLNATNWTQLGTYRAIYLKVLIMTCANDYQENGDETILTNMYSHFFVNELVHQTFSNGTYFTEGSYSDTGYEFFNLLCERFCPTGYNFSCRNNTACENTLCDSPVQCVSSTGYVYDTKSNPILVTTRPEEEKTTTSTIRA